MPSAATSPASGSDGGPDAVAFGEIGLLAEVRGVGRAAERIREAAALGFARALLPEWDTGTKAELETSGLRRVEELLRVFSPPSG